MDQPGEKPFTFLLLPAEIREKIYTYVLVRHRILISYSQTLPSRYPTSRPTPTPKGLIAITELPSNSTSTNNGNPNSNTNINTQPNAKPRFELSTPFASPTAHSILLTNRQLHHEASFILYSKNVFDFTTMPAVAPFLSLIGPRNRSFLNSIRLSSWNRLGWKLALGALAEVDGSRALEIAVWKFDTYEAQWGVFVRELWEGLQGRLGNVRFCVGGEGWARGGGNVLSSKDIEVLERGFGTVEEVHEDESLSRGPNSSLL
ncbi:hypothetical protein PRZ48_003235 [Zasmidium cellare]|uniref:Uncharacterized protein n=1 Tax=Zasmidium cellare TaxID=395010 RepID=A0ABR0EUK5_ZASCE|nr:hypothetical protein PRZ48_003235 [Zasmidium cellare]